MKQYLLSIYQPDGPPPPRETLEKIMKEVGGVRQEMIDAGAFVFTGGLHPASSATVVRVRNGEAITTDGPFVESKEHLGGFTVITAADLDAALGWAKKLAKAIAPLPIEVRPFQDGHIQKSS